MFPGFGGDKRIPLYVTAGWLFAELLLGIAMVFLVSSPGATPAPVPTPTPTATQAPTPTPTPQPLLDLTSKTLTLTGVDVFGLIQGDSGARSAFQAAVLKQLSDAQLSGKCAGLVIPYIGQPTLESSPDYKAIGPTVTNALQSLGARTEGRFFRLTAYHDPLLHAGVPYGLIDLEIFTYKNASPCQ